LITLTRYYTPLGTFGEWSVDEFKCVTLERPWLDNKLNVSCIPEGIYELKLRESPIVKKMTHKRYTQGWEVMDVKDREYVMIHPGNYVADSEACILVGEKMTVNQNKGLMITNSQNTFNKLMKELSKQDSWNIDIRGFRIEWP